MKRLAVFLLCLSAFGCGTKPVTSSTMPTVSVWAGTYAGQLNFSGCLAGTTSCGGDSITLSISEASNATIPGEFDPRITISGTDESTNAAFTGSGNALYFGAAPIGPGNGTTTATATLSNGYSLSLLSYESSATTAPEVTTKITVYKAISVNGSLVSSGVALGVLNRR